MQFGDIKVKLDPEIEQAIVDGVELAKEARAGIKAVWAKINEKRFVVKAGTHLFTDYNTDGETVYVTMNVEQWKNYLTWAEQQG